MEKTSIMSSTMAWINDQTDYLEPSMGGHLAMLDETKWPLSSIPI